MTSLLRHLLAWVILLGVAATDEVGTKYLEEKSKLPDVVTLPSGLRYKVLEHGKGGFHPQVGTPCLCHYAGTLIDGTEFDSSYSRGEPTTFAPNQVIKGWTEAMQMMVEGDKWELYIPSDLAYGDRGSPPKIPGNSALVFTIEMIEIQGEKLIALTCDPKTLEGCDEKMKDYIDKAAEKFGDRDKLSKEIERLMKTKEGLKNAFEKKEWFATRIYLLKKILNRSAKEEL